jgi:hypothetical protein
MMLLIMQFSVTYYFIPPGSTLFSNVLNLCSSLHGRDKALHLEKIQVQFPILDDKTSHRNCSIMEYNKVQF